MFIKGHRNQYPLSLVCEVLHVSPSGYHKWLRRKLSFRRIENQRILEIIRYHYNKSKEHTVYPEYLLQLENKD